MVPAEEWAYFIASHQHSEWEVPSWNVVQREAVVPLWIRIQQGCWSGVGLCCLPSLQTSSPLLPRWEIYALWVQKKAPGGKEKREKKNENDFNFFFWRRHEADIESE